MNEILTNEEAGTVLVNALSSLTGMKLKKSMLAIIGTQTLESMGGKYAKQRRKEYGTDCEVCQLRTAKD